MRSPPPVPVPAPAPVPDPAAAPAKARILAAATELFGRAAYEAVGLRDIAARAGVDVAYVHRCHGSKRDLFTTAFRSAIRPGVIALRASPDPVRALAVALLPEAAAATGTPADLSPLRQGLHILIHSLSSPEAAGALRVVIEEEVVVPFGSELGIEAAARGALAGAFAAGFGIFLRVLQIEALSAMAPQALATEVEAALRHIFSGGFPAASPPEPD